MTTGGSWAWITDHWRLKLTAGLLAVFLFGTVAFAQNPITVRTLRVRIDQYQGMQPGLVLLRPPGRVNVQVVGLSDAITPLSPDDIDSTMDLSRVAVPSSPQTVQVNVNVKTLANGVTLQQSSIPVYVTVDSVASEALPIDVRDQPAPGVTIDKVTIYRASTTEPVSQVNVTAPESVLNGLKAFVNLHTIAGVTLLPGQQVLFEDSAGTSVKLPLPTIPIGAVDVPLVDVSVAAHQSQQQKVVPLLATTTGSPACGYEITGIAWSPAQLVTLTGDATALEANSSINLNAIDVTGASANVVSHLSVTAPINVVSVTPKAVTITVEIKQVYSCSPAPPSPTPSPTPSP